MHAVKTGSGRARHVEIAARMKCQVVCRDGRLHSREHKNLAARADLENRSAAVSDVKIAGLVKRNARCNPHPFHPLLRAPVRRDAVDGAVVAAGNEKISLAVDRLASASPKSTTGRDCPRETKPLPRIAISPPGMAAAGATLSMWGLPFFSAEDPNPNFIPSQCAAREAQSVTRLAKELPRRCPPSSRPP